MNRPFPVAIAIDARIIGAVGASANAAATAVTTPAAPSLPPARSWRPICALLRQARLRSALRVIILHLVGDSFARVLASLRGAVDEVVTLVQRGSPSFAESAALAAVERMMFSKTFEFDARARRRARALLPTMHKAIRASDWATFPSPPGRLSFLAASHSLLRAKTNELLVIGLGTWKGRRSFVREVFVREGTKSSVGLPASVQAEIRGHIEDQADAELLHVHNHPNGLARDIKNMLLGDAPVPSSGDRHVLLAHVEATLQANTKGGRRRVRFHLVENDRVHEYVLPPWQVLRPNAEQLLRALGVLR